MHAPTGRTIHPTQMISRRWASTTRSSALQPCVCWYAMACHRCNGRHTAQVETRPIPHILIDIRTSEERKQHPLPAELQDALAIEGTMLGAALASDLSWRERLSAGRQADDTARPAPSPTKTPSPCGAMRPHPSTLLVLLTDDVTDGRAAAAAAAHKVLMYGYVIATFSWPLNRAIIPRRWWRAA